MDNSGQFVYYLIYFYIDLSTFICKFLGFLYVYRKGENPPLFFPQKYPQAVDKPVDILGIYLSDTLIS